LGDKPGWGSDAGLLWVLTPQVISGQFLSERSVRTYVEVELFGLPGDPKRRYRTKLSPNTNSINPVWKEEPFVFEKVGERAGQKLGSVPSSWPLLRVKRK
jgi:hypothetical protein